MSDIEDGRLYRLWIIIRDITDSKTHIQNLEHKTTHDELTVCPIDWHCLMYWRKKLIKRGSLDLRQHC